MDYCDRVKGNLPSGCEVLLDEPMSRHTTFKIGGPADLMITVFHVSGLKETLERLEEAEIPWMILGNGSNMLVSDEGIRGAVVRLDGEFRHIRREGDLLICGAAVPLTSVCTEARNCGLGGLEFAYGIPGSLGGAVYMNAGAYGGEIKDVLLSCTQLSGDGQIREIPVEELDLSYRHSVYMKNRAVILSAVLRLKEKDPAEIEDAMKDFMNRRRAKQPLEYPSAGSVFKRPEGYFAGALIEGCGLKGASVGDAQVSEKHAGFIINRGSASCKNVLDLIEMIQKKVYQETGVMLECEVKAIG